jgi:hypothetical protein
VAEDDSLDDAPAGFRALERQLASKGVKTTRSAATAGAIRGLHETWMRVYRPRLVTTLGELPAIEAVDLELTRLRSRLGDTLLVRDLRRSLREIAKIIDNEILPAYTGARWSEASAPPRERASQSPGVDDPLLGRLDDLHPALARSYRQALNDLADPTRISFLGTAGEIREVLRAVIHTLAPDPEPIKKQPWFKGHDGRPTQAERIRYIMQQRAEGESAAIQAADLVDVKVGTLGRDLYERASRAFHAGTERGEVAKIELYVRGVLLDVLPEAASDR